MLLGRQPDGFLDLMLCRAPVAAWRNTLSFVFGSVITKFNAHVGVELLEQVVCRMSLPESTAVDDIPQYGEWNLTLVMGDCLEILLGRDTAVPEKLRGFFENQVLRSIEQEGFVPASLLQLSRPQRKAARCTNSGK